MKRVVIESPLSGDFQRNYRYLLWCCRAMWLKEKAHALGSHMLSPWFMDDTDAAERQAGINNPWAWLPGVAHVFFRDLGMSRGMELGFDRCVSNSIPVRVTELREYDPPSWSAFERGEWPPHTPGFVLAGGND